MRYNKEQLKEKSLLSLYPKLAKEWYYTGNRHLRPENVAAHTHKKVWWVCFRGHHWEASINDRTRKSGGTNCPYCARKRKWRKTI